MRPFRRAGRFNAMFLRQRDQQTLESHGCSKEVGPTEAKPLAFALGPSRRGNGSRERRSCVVRYISTGCKQAAAAQQAAVSIGGQECGGGFQW